MALDSAINGGTSTANKANVDSGFNLQVNLPLVASQSGYSQTTYVPATGVPHKPLQISRDGATYAGMMRQVFDLDFNSASTSWSSKIGTVATTMTKGPQNGYMRLNSGAITTLATGICIYSNQVVTIEAGYDYRAKCEVRHANGNATNKQADIGLGYYAFAAGQAAVMNEFIGFRWTTTGGLQAVVETSQGGAPTVQATNINANLPFSDNVTREYEIVISDTDAEFWVDSVFQARISKDPGTFGLLKSAALPWLARVFNTGTASAATTFDIGDVSLAKIGADDQVPYPNRMASMGKISYNFQPDTITTNTPTHNSLPSGTSPTAGTPSNTVSTFNNTGQMGGWYRYNGAAITLTPHTNYLIAAYQNPTMPTVAGVATNARTFYVTAITVTPQVVTTVLVGGGFTAQWFAAIGGTSTSLASADADGTTGVAQKAPRVIPLERQFTWAAAAAAGATTATGVGSLTVNFPTALPINPGEFLHIGFRTIFVTAAITSGAIDGGVSVNGYWD